MKRRRRSKAVHRAEHFVNWVRETANLPRRKRRRACDDYDVPPMDPRRDGPRKGPRHKAEDR